MLKDEDEVLTQTAILQGRQFEMLETCFIGERGDFRYEFASSVLHSFYVHF